MVRGWWVSGWSDGGWAEGRHARLEVWRAVALLGVLLDVAPDLVVEPPQQHHVGVLGGRHEVLDGLAVVAERQQLGNLRQSWSRPRIGRVEGESGLRVRVGLRVKAGLRPSVGLRANAGRVRGGGGERRWVKDEVREG